jgi:hypothetical protein
MEKEKDPVAQFLALSVMLTGFERVDLLGTGLTESYYQTLTGVVSPEICEGLWAVTTEIIARYGGDEDQLNAAIRRDILASPAFGPLANNIIQMWYLGSWIELPTTWRSQFGTSPADFTHVVSAEAYKQSLIYSVMQAHPPGAKQPGFGSWSQPPNAE